MVRARCVTNRTELHSARSAQLQIAGLRTPNVVFVIYNASIDSPSIKFALETPLCIMLRDGCPRRAKTEFGGRGGLEAGLEGFVAVGRLICNAKIRKRDGQKCYSAHTQKENNVKTK